MIVDLLPLLMAGFGLGLLHALDADHIMAVSVLGNQRRGFRAILGLSGHWALGHGGTLLVCGMAFFGLGLTLPEYFQRAAECGVGLLLIILGLLCIRQFRQEKISLGMHRHGDLVHVHWQQGSEQHAAKGHHQPVLVGMLHGLAGSAPVLALMPAVANEQFLPAMCYLLLFSSGVMLAMLFFGLGFAQVNTWLNQRYQRLFQCARHALAFGSIAFGGYWLIQTV